MSTTCPHCGGELAGPGPEVDAGQAVALVVRVKAGWPSPGRRLARWLKIGLRAFGIRCEKVEAKKDD